MGGGISVAEENNLKKLAALIAHLDLSDWESLPDVGSAASVILILTTLSGA